MLEFVVFVAGTYLLIRYMYPRQLFKNKLSQTEMFQVNHKSTQTWSDSDSSMSIDLEDMEIDELFYEIKSV